MQRLSHAAWVRIFVIGALLLVAAFSWYPMEASMSGGGALDKVLFDTTTHWFLRPSSKQVVVILIDAKTLGKDGTDELIARTRTLLQRLTQVGSITLDYHLASDEHTGELAAAIAANGHVVVPVAAQELMSPMHLDDAALGHGQHHITLGHYGVVTGFVPYLSQVQGSYPNIVLEAIRVAGMTHLSPSLRHYLHSYAFLQAPRQTVLVMLGNAYAMPQYSFADVIDGKVPANTFSGRLVFVGESVESETGFRISSLNGQRVAQVQLDALMTDALISGNTASEVTGVIAVPVYLAMALGMVLICMVVPGRWMHLATVCWFIGMFLLPVLLLAGLHRWLGIGLLPMVCVLIYAHFAWERLHRTQSLLKLEVGRLRAITSTVGISDGHLTAPSALDSNGDPLQQVRRAMQEIYRLQDTLVSMINQLPYPVFVVVDNKISVWNARAADLLRANEPKQPHGDGALTDIQELVSRHCHGEESASTEVTFGGKEYMLLYVPYAKAGASLRPGMLDGKASFLVCLVDIAAIKEGVTQDRLALRHIAHDLRSPLSTVLALIEERTTGFRSEAPYDRAFLEDLRRQVDYSLRVAKEFLQLSRAEQIDPRTFVPVALLDTATEAMDQLWVAAQAKSIELIGPECTLPVTLVMGNADMLIRALINVIDNALKYSSAHTAITLSIVKEGEGSVALHIVDQGIGIDEADLQHLFEPFFQVDGGKNGGDTGVGLGLPFVKTVIERHSGSITVKSRLGQGTDFQITLPLARGSSNSLQELSKAPVSKC